MLKELKFSFENLRVHFQKISHVFISHLHGDHYFGLVGLLSSMNLLGREKAIHIYGPPALEEILMLQLQHGTSKLSYQIEFHELNFDEKGADFRGRYYRSI